MGIETSLERVANALERIASTLEANTTINDWYKNHLASKEAAKAEAALAEAKVEVAPDDTKHDAPDGGQWTNPAGAEQTAAPEMTFDELKAALAARGHVYPKGTKATTLRKEWEKYKNTAPISEPAPAAEPAPAPAAAPADPFDVPAAAPAPAPEQKPAMTKDEAAARIRAHYQATEEDRKAFIEALAAAGVPAGGSFQDVEDGKFDVLVETYEHIKGVANA